ncbi:MAG: translocation/assembly module TamB domain-containing protein [Ginsengibacter sp.]
METAKPTAPEKKRSILAKTGRVVAWILGSLILIIILILILVQVPAVQNFARKKIVSYLEDKLHTKVEIGKLNIDFPTALSLQKIYIEDQSKDTLLYGGEVKVDISMLRLISSDIEIQEISLNNITAKVKRMPPDSIFNFQFIADAFMTEQSKETATEDSSTLQMNVDRILLNNTRIVYYDPYTGNDMDLTFGHLDTKITTFDPAHLLFDIPTITLKGLKGHFYQMEPLQKTLEKTVAEASAEPGNYLQFLNKEMLISDVNIVYNSDPSHLKSSFIIGDLTINPKTIDLKNSIINLDKALLNNSTIIIETDTKAIKKVPLDSVLTVAPTPSFKIISGDLEINKSNLKFDDASAPHIPKGMDFVHLNLQDLSLKATGLEYSLDTTLVSIQSAKLTEQSGLVLDNLSADFSMNPTGVSLQNLLIETPGSLIKKSAIITYPSLAALQKDPGVLGLDIDLENSKITMKDLLTFLPALNAQASNISPNATLYIDAKITGKVNDLNFQKLILRGLTATNINVNGVIKGLPDPNKLYADLTIVKFQSSKKDISSFIPANSLPPNITIPETFSASGRVKGNMKNLYTDVAINTSLGGAKIKGSLINITNQQKAKYDLAVNARSLNLGKLMQNPKLGMLTADVKVKGSGFKPETANATFNGVIDNVTLNNYNYRNIKLDGGIAHKNYKVNASIHDPNLEAVVEANGEFLQKFPSVHIKATIDSINTQPLGFTPQPLKYHGQIDGDFSSVDPDNLAGNLFVTHSIFVNNGQRITLDSLEVNADNTPGNHSLSLKSDFLSATINGQYKLTQLADVFQQSIDPYFSITEKRNVAKVDPYNFTITAGAIENAALKAFLPDIKKMKPVNLSSHFSNDSGWSAYMTSPLIVYGDMIIDDLKFGAATKNGILSFNTSLNQLKSGSSLAMYATTLNGILQNNNLNFTLNIQDAKSRNKYTVSGLLSQPAMNNYSFSLKPDSLLLNYNKWSVTSNNSIQYSNNDITATNFILSQGSQQLGINSVGSGSNKPLRIDFINFNIATLTGFVQNDSLLVGGLLNGNAVVKNIQVQPNFTTELTVQDLSIYKDTIGNLTAKVNNDIANTFNANISLKGYGNEVNILGDYFLKPQNKSSYDFTVDIVALQMKSLEGFTKGGIKNARGNLYGKIALNGSLEDPNVDGRINFNETAFTASALNNVFKVDKEAIAIVNNEGIKLNTFTIRDTANNAIVIDGMLNTVNFYDYVFDLTIKADNFQAINSTKKDNKLFYGKMVFSTDLTIKGTPTQPIVDGTLVINDQTDFSVVLPQAEPGVVQREGIVRFVDYSALPEDSLFMLPYDSLNVSALLGYDVSLNINVTRGATFNLIVDEGNGDFLKIKGDGQLTAGIDPSGKVTLVGSYEINEGSYDLSFNFIKRKFLIQKGSRIVWTGEPTTAQVDVTAIYIANTAPLDLVLGQTEGDPNTYKQKLPFEVNLGITGELMQPQITFDIKLPADRNYNVGNNVTNAVQIKLAQLRQEPGEMNKQVFALLLLNRFVSENPFDNSSGGSLDANTFARQSVSRLLTEQLNQLTEGLIEGVDINFDLASTEDYTTGSKQNRTDFNVGLSKRLLNDRLTVTVGSNFELEGPRATNKQQNNVAGNIAIDYKLSKDGRYMLRAYRKNDYTAALEGYVIETGIGFIISVDFNKFRQIFLSKEQRQQKREIKKQNKEDKKGQDEEDQQQQQSITASPAKENTDEK